MSDGKCVFGLEEKMASLVAYAGFWVTGIIILVMEKDNKTVRFHALQSTILFAAINVVFVVLGFLIGWIPVVGGLVLSVLGLCATASWLFLMYMAYMGKKFKIPVLGDVCEAQIGK